jgi:hypothetical protein
MGPNSPGAGSISAQEADALRLAFARNGNDLGVGLYNPQTGEIHVASFDLQAPGGHADLAAQLGLQLSEWRGFVVDALGRFSPVSHLNGPGLRMPADMADVVEAELRQAGLVR